MASGLMPEKYPQSHPTQGATALLPLDLRGFGHMGQAFGIIGIWASVSMIGQEGDHSGVD